MCEAFSWSCPCNTGQVLRRSSAACDIFRKWVACLSQCHQIGKGAFAIMQPTRGAQAHIYALRIKKQLHAGHSKAQFLNILPVCPDRVGAIRWARENAGRYGGDQEDLVLVGHSAGAHLAALCLSDPRWLEEAGVIFPSSTSTRSASTNAAAADHPGASFGAATPTESSLPMPEQQQAHQGRQDRPRQSATKTTVSTPPPLARQPSPMVHVVSGFVGISGVYDIPRMAGNVIGRALANAAFGSDRRLWRRASPVHCVRAAAARAAAAATASARLGRSSTVRAKTTATMEATATAVAHTRSVVAEETSRGNVANRQAAHPGDASPARTGTSKRIFDGVAASVPVAAGEEAAITTPTTAVQDVYTSASHIGTATDAESVFSNKNLVARKPNRISSDAVATGVCPLLSTRVLLLTASSDFHLKEDAEALSAALDDARKRGPGLTPAPSPAIPARNCRNSQRRAIDIALSESVKDGLAEPNARSRPRTIEDDGERADRGFECSEGGRGDGDGDGDGSVGVNDVIDCRNGGGSGDRGDDGSVRHVYLEGEDHMSTMITFGEPGKEASDTVLDFILGLPAPRRPSPRE